MDEIKQDGIFRSRQRSGRKIEDKMIDRILTIPAVAEYLQVSKAKIYIMIQKKEIPYIRLNRNVRIRESELIKWLDKQTVQK